jgi:hypothetical protein
MKKSQITILMFILFIAIMNVGCVYGIEKAFNQLQIISSGIFLIGACIVSIVIFGFISTLICGLICFNNQKLFKGSIPFIGISCLYACIFKGFPVPVNLMIIGFLVYYVVTVNNIIKIEKSKNSIFK